MKILILISFLASTNIFACSMSIEIENYTVSSKTTNAFTEHQCEVIYNKVQDVISRSVFRKHLQYQEILVISGDTVSIQIQQVKLDQKKYGQVFINKI